MTTTKAWPPLGLCYKVPGKEDESVALLRCETVADIADDDAGVRLNQIFSNPSFGSGKDDQEAVYKFPLVGNVAVYYFKSSYLSESGDALKTLCGKAKEKQQAREEYEQAKANGKAAQLLEIDYENSPDLFVMSLGNIPSNCKSVSVEIAFYCPLQTEERGVVKRFTMPSILTGRYGKYTPSAFKEANVKGSSALFSFEANICLGNYVSSLESPTHTITSKLMIGGSPNRAQVTFAKDTEPLHKDLVLKISSASSPKSSLLVQAPESIPNKEFSVDFPDTTLAKLTFNCEIETPEEAELKKNFIFVVDRSGSMSGASMTNCKKALQLCLASLPEDCCFDICSFGSRFDFLFAGNSQDYSEETLTKARAHVEKMSANYGGTEILKPLQKIVEAIRDIPTVVFLLTDGQVYNTATIVSLIKKEHEKSGTTMFTCGIGSGVDRNLVDGLAKAGGGTATYISYGEKMNAKLAAQMEQAIEPPCTSLKVDLGDLQLSSSKLGWNPTSLLPAFAYTGQRVDCYFTLDSNSLLELRKKLEGDETVANVTLRGKLSVEGKEENIVIAEVDLKKELLETESNLIVPAFRQRITLVEEAAKAKKSEKKKAINFAVAANIVTKYTSLVAVEEGNETQGTEAEVEKPKQKVHEREVKEMEEALFKFKKMSAPKAGRKRMKGKEKKRKTRSFKKQSVISSGNFAAPQSSVPLLKLEEEKEDFSFAYNSFDQQAVPKSSMLPLVGGGGPPMPESISAPAAPLFGTPKPNTLSSDDKLSALISLQKMNGSFEVDALKAIVGVEDFGEDVKLEGFATALAIKFMEIKLTDLKAEWKLINKKAMKWLKKNSKDWQAVLTAAEKYV